MASLLRKAGCAVSLVCSVGAASASAQTQQQATGDTAARSDFDIVVTAQRRSELSRDVPIAIVSVSGDQLDRANVQQIADLGKLTPGVRFRGSSNFLQPSIRGVSTSLVGSGVGSNVGIYVDGFYASTAAGSNFQLLNTESIQVLKGPQGTLFGRNTTGGAILVTTVSPSVETDGSLELSYDRFDAARAQGYFTTGLSETVAFDIEGLISRGDGYFNNVATDNRDNGQFENWSLRMGLEWRPSDAASFLFRYQHSSTDDPTFIQTNAIAQNGRALTIGAVIPGTPIATRPGTVAQSARQPASFTAETDIYQLTGKIDAGFADLASYTQYRSERTQGYSDLDASAADVAYLILPQSVKIFTQELLLTSKPGPALQWTVGAFMLDQKDSFPASLLSISGGAPQLTAATGLKTRSFAAYADATYQLGEKVFLTGGVRYTREKGFDAFRFSGPLTGDLGLVEYPDLTRNYVTPRLVLRYKPDTSSNLYASITRGTKAGIIDTNDSDIGARIRPEKLTSYEIGYKYGGRALSIDLSAYYYDYKDLQVSIPIGTAMLVRNAANSRIYGGEAQVRYTFGSGFDLNAGAAYNNARYRKFPNSQVFTQCLDFAACGAGYGLFPIQISDSSGFRMQMAPELTANLSPSFSFGLGGGEAMISGNFYYSSSYYLDTSQQFRQSDYATLDLRAEWTDPSEHYTLALYGTNVTDKRYLLQVGMNNFGIGGLWSAPATYGASIKARF